MNKYEQDLLQCCSTLDDVTNSDGKISDCARAIIENNEEASKKLCKIIEKASELKDPHITRTAIAAKDSLIKFYGHQRLAIICSSKEIEEDPITLREFGI